MQKAPIAAEAGAAFKKALIAVAAGTAVLLGTGLIWVLAGLASPGPSAAEAPRERLPRPPAHVDHAKLISDNADNLPDGPSVTRACLACHPNSAHEVMQTSHWTWTGQKAKLGDSDQVVQLGKKNVINNFCIHAGPNIESCSSCHAGYGWKDSSFDFSNPELVDCLVCHDQTGLYEKGDAGQPKPGVDLVAAAKSVGRPTRRNCGQCHFKGGGGDAVKHGDLDGTVYLPSERIDVHMGRLDMQCVDCHRTQEHVIPGLAMSIAPDRPERVGCTDCHSPTPHQNARLDWHTRSVACETCHIPRMAIDAPTKMTWDWSEAGQDRPEDPHRYLKKKGSFTFAQNIRPEYHWYNGRGNRYLTGDKIDPSRVVQINRPLGGPEDQQAKIFPFKIHRGKQPYDKIHRHLLTPKTYGPGGYWREFDWSKACRLGAQETGVEFSGEYGFVETEMYWPLSHMVQSKEKALQCIECHGPQGIMDWQKLGFPEDPAFRGRPILAGPQMEGKNMAADNHLPEGEQANTGWIFSPQRMSESSFNLKDKEQLARPWDVHAAKLLDCTSCHVPLTQSASTPDGNRLSATARDSTDDSVHGQWRSTRACTDCHATVGTHEWLPKASLHFASLSCQACHIPQVHAPALRQRDWTNLTPQGQPRVSWRGTDGDPRDPAVLISGFEPVLLPRTGADGRSRLTPHNLVTEWRQAEANASKATPPRIDSKVQAYPLNHGVAPARWAIRSCETCHSGDSRLNEAFVLGSRLDGASIPKLDASDRTALDGEIREANGMLVYAPASDAASRYVPGHHRSAWIDWFGGLVLASVVGGVTVHAGFRLRSRRSKNQGENRG